MLAGATVAVLGALACLLPTATASAAHRRAGKHAPVSPADVAATGAYLRAVYEYDLAYLANMPQVQASAADFVRQLREECPNVLSGAKKGLDRESQSSPESSRAFGEQTRAREQLQGLEEELSSAAQNALRAPERQAFTAFAKAVEGLSWSNPAIHETVLFQLQGSEARLAGEPLPVCADMAAWVNSAYSRLSASSKAFISTQEAQRHSELRSHQPVALVSLTKALTPYETDEDRELIARAKQLAKEIDNALVKISTTLEDGRSTVGLQSERRLRAELRSLQDSTELGSGSTATGGSFQVSVVKRTSRKDHGCKFRLSVHGSAHPFSGEGTCLPSRGSATPRVVCEEDERIVEAILAPEVRQVRLLLTGGRIITSKVIAIPKRAGGPASFYFQAVPRGPAVPLSLTELGAHGEVLGTLALPSARICVRHRVHFLHDGIVKLASGQVPGGPKFAIKGEAYAYNGPVYFSLSVEVENGSGGGQNLSGFYPRSFTRAFWTKCSPVQYAIVYGVLKQSSDRMAARAGGETVALSTAPIPAHLHAGGVLFYGVFTTPPETLVLENPEGKTIATEDLAAFGKEETEYCEGLDEEPGRTPLQEEEGSIIHVGD
jgi:hypothetical protein